MKRDTILKFIKIKKDYNKNFTKYSKDKKKPLAWVSSFVPIEILYAMDIDFVFPESYAAVIASSGAEEKFIEKSQEKGFDSFVCSYSTCFNGSYMLNEGPNGVPLKPDVLIASNNQCNTLTGWWNYLSNKLKVPLFVLDYPGESKSKDSEEYIIKQYEKLIEFLKEKTERKFDENIIYDAINNSIKSISSWKKILDLSKENYVPSNITFDYLLPLIIARNVKETGEFYDLFYEELKKEVKPLKHEKRVLWSGYPLWYSPKRYLSDIEDDSIKITANDYSSWWNLEYKGDDWEHKLACAYNYTILNKTLKSRIEIIRHMIREYKIDGVIFNSNKSCKRESSCIYPIKNSIDIPSVVINSDMVDRSFLNTESTNLKLETFKGVLS